MATEEEGSEVKEDLVDVTMEVEAEQDEVGEDEATKDQER